MAGKGKGKAFYEILNKKITKSKQPSSSVKKVFNYKVCRKLELPEHHEKNDCYKCFVGYERKVRKTFDDDFYRSDYYLNTVLFFFNTGRDQDKTCVHYHKRKEQKERNGESKKKESEQEREQESAQYNE